MGPSRAILATVCLLVFASLAPAAPAEAGGPKAGKGILVDAGTIRLEIRSAPPEAERGRESRQTIGAQKAKSGMSPALEADAKTPNPDPSAVVAAPPPFGFNGLNHRDQRLAGTGAYANTQFSLEPPDQGLCVGNGFVLETVNTALRVRTTTGAIVTPATPINQFLGLAPEIDRTIGTFGDFTADPKCYYDVDTDRWFFTVLQIDVDPVTGAFGTRSHVEIAVSKTGAPAGDASSTWEHFRLDATNDGIFGTPAHPGCPCFGDQPLIGADANGFYISTNEFSIGSFTFNGAQIYAISKSGLAAAATAGGGLPTVAHLAGGPLAEGISYSVQPATTPPGGAHETANGGTEYFLSALDFAGRRDDRIAVWKLTNTGSLSGTPSLTLTKTVIASQAYGQPPAAEQRDGDRPLGEVGMSALFGIKGKGPLSLLESNDDRMNQVVYAAGKLWGALNTIVRSGGTQSGVAWFVVDPVGLSVVKQGYVAVKEENAMFPSIGVNALGRGAMTFTLVGKGRFPSAAYVLLDGTSGASDVHIAAAGLGPQDGFSGYRQFSGTRVARWGDYSAATVDAAGDVWLAVEYIAQTCDDDAYLATGGSCGGTRTALANWGTFIFKVTP